MHDIMVKYLSPGCWLTAGSALGEFTLFRATYTLMISSLIPYRTLKRSYSYDIYSFNGIVRVISKFSCFF
jgi:hypothetical protein